VADRAHAHSELCAEIRRELGQRPDCRIWPNPSGVARHASGHTVRYGVAPGGSDLIGIVARRVTPADVGRLFGLFLAIEVKSGGATLEPHQRTFIEIIRRFGGLAGECRSIADALALIDRGPGAAL
jgi:hypothetical protein